MPLHELAAAIGAWIKDAPARRRRHFLMMKAGKAKRNARWRRAQVKALRRKERKAA